MGKNCPLAFLWFDLMLNLWRNYYILNRGEKLQCRKNMTTENKPTVSTHTMRESDDENIESLGGPGPLSPDLKARIDAVLKMIRSKEMKKNSMKNSACR